MERLRFILFLWWGDRADRTNWTNRTDGTNRTNGTDWTDKTNWIMC